MDKFNLIADHLSDGIMEIDASGIITFCNKKAAELDDIIVEQVVGKPLFSVYPTLNKDTSTLYRVLETGEPILNFSQTFSNYNGKVIVTINSTLPIYREGQVVGALEISSDVTNVKMMSEKIIELQRRINEKVVDSEKPTWDSAHYQLSDIITRDATMLKLKEKVIKAALSDAAILVCGETGTGKELFVQSIHAASKRADKPFIAQNCAALPASLLEGILFGTVEGAFTGATNRVGLLEAADGGTVFLDELNAMPLALQAKLLRFLQDGKVRRLGEIKSKKINVRIIAALNQSSEEAINAGLLRRDLYYRLSIIVFDLPPLRDRRDDILLLTEYFINKINTAMKRNAEGVSAEVADLFLAYHWPGNVRELEHVIEGAISMLDDTEITVAELPTKLLREANKRRELTGDHLNLYTEVSKLERELIEKALQATGGNVTAAAKGLGIPRQTLQYKLRKLEVSF